MTMSEAQRKLLERVEALGVAATDPSPRMQSAMDLARESVERLAAQIHGTPRVLDSAGWIHLAGHGVEDHEARLASVAKLLGSLQTVVDAIGANLLNVKSRTRLPESVTRRTTLMLEGTPGVGSLTFRVKPRLPGLDDANPQGEGLLGWDDNTEALADRCIEELAGLLHKVDPSAPTQDGILERIRPMGSRVATSLRSFAEEVDRGDFDLDLTWHPTGRPTVKAELSATDARALVASIKANDLEKTDDTIEGVVKTSSDSRKLEIEGSSGSETGVFQISRGDLSDSEIHQAAVFTRVRVRVSVIMREAPGGEVTPIYTAQSLDVIAE